MATGFLLRNSRGAGAMSTKGRDQVRSCRQAHDLINKHDKRVKDNDQKSIAESQPRTEEAKR